MKLKVLTEEIEGLHYFLDDYAETLDNDEDREKMADAAGYLMVLKRLIILSPEETLEKIQL